MIKNGQKFKNAWLNLNSFLDDHTRVRLRNSSNTDEEKEEYLNANFVDGFRQPRAYIATQVT